MCNKEYMIILLLKSLAINYPILKDWGLPLEKLLVIQVSDNNRSVVKESLHIFQTILITTDLKKKEIFKTLEESNSEFVFFDFNRNTRGRIILDYIYEAVFLGVSRAIPVVLTSVAMPEEIAEKTMMISLTELSQVVYIPFEEIVPKEDELGSVREMIGFCRNNSEKSAQSLLYAAAFTYPCFKRKKDDSSFKSLLALANDVYEISENRYCTDGIEEWFLKELFKMTDSMRIPMYDISLEYKEFEDTSIYYDKEYVFISNKLFQNISEELLKVYDSETIKRCLCEKRMLVSENGETFTYKMPFRDLSGGYKRVRMLRFQREKMNKFGELDIVEKYKIKGAV